MSQILRRTSGPATLGLLGTLYFSQGLPFGFFTQALPLVLRQAGHSLGAIGLSSLLALPWALKFLWAPAVDWPGRRRRWIMPLQASAAAVLAALALWPALPIGPLLVAVLVLNALAATQDIATDGLAVDLLAPAQRGVANGLQVAGYRLGMIAGGGALLILHDCLGPRATFLVMAALLAAATLPVCLWREPTATPRARPAHFLRRPGSVRLLVLIAVYKAGDAFAVGMLRPFLADAGFGLADIGWLLGTVGFVAGLVGALGGGLLADRIGRGTALVLFGALQAASVAGYALVALHPTPAALPLVCALEHLTGGMATAALFTCMMDWSAQASGGTDYTVQASAVVIATGVASALAGFSAQTLGYAGHFTLAAVLAGGAVLLTWRLFPSPRAAVSPVAEAA